MPQRARPRLRLSWRTWTSSQGTLDCLSSTTQQIRTSSARNSVRANATDLLQVCASCARSGGPPTKLPAPDWARFRPIQSDVGGWRPPTSLSVVVSTAWVGWAGLSRSNRHGFRRRAVRACRYAHKCATRHVLPATPCEQMQRTFCRYAMRIVREVRRSVYKTASTGLGALSTAGALLPAQGVKELCLIARSYKRVHRRRPWPQTGRRRPPVRGRSRSARSGG